MSRILACLALLAALWVAPGLAHATCTPATIPQATYPTVVCATIQEADTAIRATTCSPYFFTGYTFDHDDGIANGPHGSNMSFSRHMYCKQTSNPSNIQTANAFADYPVSGGCPAGTTWSTVTHSCNAPCSATGSALGSMAQLEGTPASDGTYTSHIQTCNNGCQYFNNTSTGSYTRFKIDGSWYIDVTGWIPSGSSCTANTTTTPPLDTDGDGTSDPNDGAPGDPGSTGKPGTGTNPDGSACGGTGQPVCQDKTDGSNHTSTGGGDCTTPPNSSGDPILAQIAFQTWATRCQLVKNANTGTGGQGGGIVVNGTDMTATNGKLDGIRGALDGAATTLTGIKNWLTGSDGGHSDDTTGLDVSASTAVVTKEVSSTILDQTGFGWSRSCPTPPSFEFRGDTYTFHNENLCAWLTIGGWFVLLITGWRCIQTVVNA